MQSSKTPRSERIRHSWGVLLDTYMPLSRCCSMPRLSSVGPGHLVLSLVTWTETKKMTQIEHRLNTVPENNTIKHYYNKHSRLDKKLLSVIFKPDFHKMTQCLASSNRSTLR